MLFWLQMGLGFLSLVLILGCLYVSRTTTVLDYFLRPAWAFRRQARVQSIFMVSFALLVLSNVINMFESGGLFFRVWAALLAAALIGMIRLSQHRRASALEQAKNAKVILLKVPK